MKPKPVPDQNLRNVEESYSTKEKTQNIKRIKTSIIK